MLARSALRAVRPSTTPRTGLSMREMITFTTSTSTNANGVWKFSTPRESLSYTGLQFTLAEIPDLYTMQRICNWVPWMASGFGVAFASLLYVHDAQVAMIVGLKNIILIWGVTTMGLMLWLLTAWPTLPIGSSCLRQSKMWFFCGRVWWSRCTPSRVWDTFHMTGFILYASSTLQDLYKTLGCFTHLQCKDFHS